MESELTVQVARKKVAGKATGAVIDAVSLGGVGTWKSFATFVGSDLAFA